MSRAASILILFLICLKCYNQETSKSELISTIAEELASDESSTSEAADFIERLNELAETPVFLNSATETELSRLFFLSDFQIKSLADYIHSSGRILSVFEISTIAGFDREITELMIPFISLNSSVIQKRDSASSNNNLIINFSYKPDKADTTSLGSQSRILAKYRFRAGNFSGGFTTEKDPGEKFFSGYPPVPDFLSANLTYSGTGIVRKIILGDYSTRFGLGTNTNSGIRSGLSLSSSGFISTRNEIKPYTSSGESGFFRGIAALLSYRSVDLTLFYSQNNLDATLSNSDDYSDPYIETILTAGVHNTESLLQKKDNLINETFGTNISARYKNMRLGFTWSGDRFSLPLKKDEGDPGQSFDFGGEVNNVFTLSYNGLIKRNLLYGEISTDEYNNKALIQGLTTRPSDRLTINILYRDYQPGFFSFHGRGPGQGTGTKNENGITGSFSFEAARHLFLSGGVDVVSYEWLKYRCSSPSGGFKKELKARYLPNESVTFELAYSTRLSEYNNSESTGIPAKDEIFARNIKFSFRYNASENLSFHTRVDLKKVNPSNSKGYMMFQDISLKFRRFPATLWYRYCIYNTDDWDSRIYAYENDLLYSFSIPALSGKGSRSYLMAKLDLGKNAEIRIKYGILSQQKDQFLTNNIEEIKAQIRVWF